MAAHGSIPYATAWCLVALARSPSELPYVHNVAARMKALGMPAPGVTLDSWAALGVVEQRRRLTWIERHGATPLASMGVTREAVERAELHVVEWELPAEHRAIAVAASRGTHPG